MLHMLAVFWMVFSIGGMIWVLSCVEKYLHLQTNLYKMQVESYRLEVSKNRRERFCNEMIAKGATFEAAEKAGITNEKLHFMQYNPQKVKYLPGVI